MIELERWEWAAMAVGAFLLVLLVVGLAMHGPSRRESAEHCRELCAPDAWKLEAGGGCSCWGPGALKEGR